MAAIAVDNANVAQPQRVHARFCTPTHTDAYTAASERKGFTPRVAVAV